MIQSNPLPSHLFKHIIEFHQGVRIFVQRSGGRRASGRRPGPEAGRRGVVPRHYRGHRAVAARAWSPARRTAGRRGGGMGQWYSPVVNTVHGVPITAGPVRGARATRAPRSPTFTPFTQVRGVEQCPAGYFATNGYAQVLGLP